MNFARKVCITLAAAAVGVGLLGFSTPADARDSSWGCGGPCLVAPNS